MKDTHFNRRMELAKLIISVTVPIMIGICGYFVQKSIVAFETHRELTNDMTVKLTDRRLSVYDRISLPLNNIYCYIEEVCDWETLSAEEVKAIRKFCSGSQNQDTEPVSNSV